MEAEIGVMCAEGGGRGHKPKYTGGHKKLKKARKRFYCSELLEGVQPCQHLNFSPVILAPDFRPLEW